MKKFLAAFVVFLFALVAWSGWAYRSSESLTLVSSWAWTNVGNVAVQVSGFDTRFCSNATGEISFSRIRSNRTNTWLRSSFTTITNLSITQDSFLGLPLWQNDVLRIENQNSVTNYGILSLEANI